MARQFPDLVNAVEWNLIARLDLQATELSNGKFAPIPAQNRVSESSVLIVGVRVNNAPSSWKTGGWIAQAINFLPSSTTQFPAFVQSSRQWLQLGRQNLVVFPQLGLPYYLLELSFPRWFTQVYAEIWRYDGPDINEFDKFTGVSQQLSTIEAKVDSL